MGLAREGLVKLRRGMGPILGCLLAEEKRSESPEKLRGALHLFSTYVVSNHPTL